MRKANLIIVLIAFAATIYSCTSYQVYSAGDLSLAATRNIDKSVDYKQLKAYVGISKTDLEAAKSSTKSGIIKKKNPIVKEINAYKGKYLQDAIDNVVKSVPGGEYLYNLRLYTVVEIVKGFYKTTYTYNYVASGDVWGVDDGNANIKGFHNGDKVVFTYTKDIKKLLGKNFEGEIGKQYSGQVIGLKGGFATIKLENSTILDIPYANLTNLGK